MKLGYVVLMVAVGAMLMFAPAAMGAKGDKARGDKNAVNGKVTAVDTTANTITIAVMVKKDAPAEKDKTITTNKDTTKVFIGETAATLADVKEGVRVAVTLADDGKTAAKIVIMPPHEKKTK